MSEQKKVRGMHFWDAKGMVFTEMHENYELTSEGFQGISLQVGENVKYYYLDKRSLHDVEETVLNLWLALRDLRKEHPRVMPLIKTF